MARRPIDYFILDALANDIESVDDVLRMLNSDSELGWKEEHGGAFLWDDVVGTLLRLVQDGLVFAASLDDSGREMVSQPERTPPHGPIEFAYFGLTPQGRIVHTSWEP